MASQSSQSNPREAQRVAGVLPGTHPYRDNTDSNDTEPPPLLQDHEPYQDDPNQLPARRPADLEQPSTEPQDRSHVTPDESRRQFNYVRFHQATLVLAVLLLLFSLVIFLVDTLLSPKFYNFPYSVEAIFQGILVSSVITLAWAIGNLRRHRRNGTLLSHAFGTLIHACLATWCIISALNGLQDTDPGSAEYRCKSWYGRPPDDPETHKCIAFATPFAIVLCVYLALLFLFGLLHTVLFVACLTPTYRSLLSDGGLGGFRVPGGELSMEFTIRFLRQDSPPALGPPRGMPQTVPEQPASSN